MTDAQKWQAADAVIDALLSATAPHETTIEVGLTVARLKREHGAKWIEAFEAERGRDDG